ncbi:MULTISPECIES: organomercurial lyase [unclassified Phenylobacterium]|uniref:organomercurial lyase n=1 Tax=unclassified Phenylobacterium TaxID=2640670 RepID=UPI000A93E86D|nr:MULTISPECIES: organomercurial lyase [unclassified Phenylobacterium]
MVRTSLARAARRPTISFPGGVAIPDWRAVTSPSAQDALRAVFRAFIGPNWGGMDEGEDQVRRAVLQGYVESGRAPTPTEIAAIAGLSSHEVASALQRLASRDLATLDSAGRVSGAYPFTDAPTEHCVETSGVSANVMCAIDVLGIGAMLERDCRVRSACRHCRRTLRIDVGDRGRQIRVVEPAAILVWSGGNYADGCAASSLCTLQALFCGDDHLSAWLAIGPIRVQDGVRLSLPEALEVSRAIFAPMRMELRTCPSTT